MIINNLKRSEVEALIEMIEDLDTALDMAERPVRQRRKLEPWLKGHAERNALCNKLREALKGGGNIEQGNRTAFAEAATANGNGIAEPREVPDPPSLDLWPHG